MTDEAGAVSLWLPEGEYRFRADFLDFAFWSGTEDHCAVPGCDVTLITTYARGTNPRMNQTIDYSYDGLYRLIAANYDSGDAFLYQYDAVGNRLAETRQFAGDIADEVNTYTYDIANRMTSVNGISYTWHANGNLLNDGTASYSYDAANR